MSFHVLEDTVCTDSAANRNGPQTAAPLTNLYDTMFSRIEDAVKFVLQVGDDTDGGYRFSETDLELFRSLSTAMFTTGVSYLVATSCTAVYYGASVAVRSPGSLGMYVYDRVQ